ncbi:hypothetical protein LZ554_005515 [Drepanopeziza brunnea f. sp. 'monogermtubi']|nr:hypothetical protein LZ554_005515 [Drepanopeziza brunnea f. sp. 'monogermtubi']
MTSILPPIPRVIFTVFEPISLIAGCLGTWISAEWFVAEQIPNSVQVALSNNATLVTYQLGNCYFLLCLVGLGVLYTTTEAKVVRNYVIALWLADISHVGITYWMINYDQKIAISDWNVTTWGNIGVTVFLFLIRTGYLLGLFGPDRNPVVPRKKVQ